jgi:hypothetical protein
MAAVCIGAAAETKNRQPGSTLQKENAQACARAHCQDDKDNEDNEDEKWDGKELVLSGIDAGYIDAGH